MDNLTRGSVKSLVTIRNLIDASIENERKPQPNALRAGCFKWKKNDRNFNTDRKEECTSILHHKDCSEEEDSDEFSDALSHAEACSLAMVSDLNSSEEDGSDGKEEQESSRNFMMERFLPAASAMASKSPHQTRVPTPVRDSGQKGPAPPQSRPRLTRTASDESIQFKVACGGIFSSRLKNAFAFAPSLAFLSPRKGGKKERSFYSPQKKRFSGKPVVCKDEDDETSSGTDEERAVIVATRRKAWEARYRQQKLLMKCSPLTGGNSSDFTTIFQSNSPFTKPSPTVISPFRNEASASPFSREEKGFLGFPADRRQKKSTQTNEIEQEQFYSGHTSPRKSSDSSPINSKSFYIYSDGIKSSPESKSPVNDKTKIEEYPVSVLPPPLPKSPSESWLCRAIPRLTGNSSTVTMKTERQDFDDAKWEI
ncbi:hypothetical protein SUGI_0391420 [Cryptomeria japonica]|uniref:uncharacterized protein LOC131063607 n=1 Tax=Cryptomeria japonica TaxID=3369 RepID=UPI002408BD47|nr:uncharacterized protein LOC131063607 [Cryptomeria japonica]GLJ21303.1 hypothetical protein SUGI_0391420 [Cryptomeria japonica]